MLNWYSVTASNDRKFLVKGTEIARAIVPETFSRFQICEMRTYDDVEYVIRDAHTVSDAEVKEGVRPKIVFRSQDMIEALNWAIEKGRREAP